jgi:hypothetical protein
MKLEDVVIRDNGTTMEYPHYGGGMAISGGSTVMMKNVHVYGNKTLCHGGGIGLRMNSTMTGEDLVISDNVCSSDGHGKGGGLYVDLGSSMTLYRSVITNNVASKWGGGVAVADDAFVSLVNVTINGNFAGIGGGAIYCCYVNSYIFLGNCILSNNLADLYQATDQEVYFDETGDKNQIAFCHSDIEGGLSNMFIPSHSQATELEGNIDEIPYFNPDLSLASPSFCIDAGTDHYTYWGEELINIPPDQYHGAMPDMGAYENWDVILQLPDMGPASMDWTKLYPNPVNQTLNVEITDPGSKKVELSLYDEKGALCLQDHFSVSKTGKSILTLSLASFSPGNYTLTIHSQTRHSTKKLVVF